MPIFANPPSLIGAPLQLGTGEYTQSCLGTAFLALKTFDSIYYYGSFILEPYSQWALAMLDPSLFDFSCELKFRVVKWRWDSLR